MAANSDIKQLTFEKAIEELESIVSRLEGGKVPLEESVAIYERGEALKRRCEELLRQAEASSGGRLVSVLEGGYDLQGLKESVAEHVTALMGA